MLAELGRSWRLRVDDAPLTAGRSSMTLRPNGPVPCDDVTSVYIGAAANSGCDRLEAGFQCSGGWGGWGAPRRRSSSSTGFSTSAGCSDSVCVLALFQLNASSVVTPVRTNDPGRDSIRAGATCTSRFGPLRH